MGLTSDWRPIGRENPLIAIRGTRSVSRASVGILLGPAFWRRLLCEEGNGDHRYAQRVARRAGNEQWHVVVSVAPCGGSTRRLPPPDARRVPRPDTRAFDSPSLRTPSDHRIRFIAIRPRSNDALNGHPGTLMDCMILTCAAAAAVAHVLGPGITSQPRTVGKIDVPLDVNVRRTCQFLICRAENLG